MLDIPRATAALAEQKLGAWLFCNFQHRDGISDLILDMPRRAVNSRPWFYLLPQQGAPTKIVHLIESHILDHLPGSARAYGSREELLRHLRELSRPAGETACQFSEELPALSTLDHGTALLLRACGFTLRSSAALIQLVLGVLSREGIASHERAARALYGVVKEVWQRLRRQMRSGSALTEATVQGWILSLFAQEGLDTDSPPIVAAGPHSADPHYDPRPEAPGGLEPDAVLQLDLWAKEKRPGAIYADISWVGVLGTRVEAEVGRAFAAVVEAREAGLRYIADALRRGSPPTGEEVDRAVRAVLQRAGYGAGLKHRTGHAIDEHVHGFGANLDSVEFPDSRRLLEGSCFSIEPGVYLQGFGVRTEINVYLAGSRPVISGDSPQSELLTF
jgi:Xaa-Pro dipeptidase